MLYVPSLGNVPFCCTSTQFTVRLGQPPEAEIIREVHRLSVTELAKESLSAQQIKGWIAIDDPDSFSRYLTDPDYVTIVAVSQECVIGFAVTHGNELDKLYTHPQHALGKKGVGTELLRAQEEIVRARGHNEMVLTASPVGVPFYQKRGFTTDREFGYETKNGSRLPCHRMKKPLILSPSITPEALALQYERA